MRGADGCQPPGRSDPVRGGRHAGQPGAIGTAVEAEAGLDPVADDPAAAVLADRRQRVDGALEAVEGVARPLRDDLERLVVVVAANLAARHGSASSLQCELTRASAQRYARRRPPGSRAL